MLNECLFFETENIEDDLISNLNSEDDKDESDNISSHSLIPSFVLSSDNNKSESRNDLNKNGKVSSQSSFSSKQSEVVLKSEDPKLVAEVWCKLRASFLLYSWMILLSFVMKKFEYIRPLLVDIGEILDFKKIQENELLRK